MQAASAGLGIPDQYIEHGPRDELLADLGLDADGIAQACRQMAESNAQVSAQIHVKK